MEMGLLRQGHGIFRSRMSCTYYIRGDGSMRSDEKITKPFYRVSYTKRFEDDKDYLELFYYGNNALDVFAEFFSENFDDEPEGLELAKLLPNYDEEKDEFKLDRSEESRVGEE